MTDVFLFLPQQLAGKQFLLYDCGSSVVMRLYRNVSKNDFDDCCHNFSENGFILLQHNEIGCFSSATYKSDSGTAVLSFSSDCGSLRICFDAYTALLNTVPDNSGTADIKLWQFEVDHSLIDCGMCYIIQCRDFSFFIIDSAHFYSVNDDKRIYDFLRKHTPAGRQVIVKGWFFSHGHVDHIAKFTDLLRFNKDIIIEGLYYNFVPLNHFSNNCWFEADKNHTKQFLYETALRDIPVYKLHSGQYFYISSVRFDVMCTHEDVFPDSLENYNDSSTVLMMNACGNKVCFPGDAGARENDLLLSRYGNDLSCDIIQVSHHGHFGLSADFYRAASAGAALFPTTRIKFDEDFPRYEANRVACEKAFIKFIASDGTVQFTFPLKNSEIIKYPDEITENFDGIYNLWTYEYTEAFKEEIRRSFSENSSIKKYIFK